MGIQRQIQRGRHARAMALAKRRDDYRASLAGPRKTLRQVVEDLMAPEMTRVRALMEPHALYDRGDPVAEGRRGWMSHPCGDPNRPDKGLRDGSCNRTACQDNLAGRPRWSRQDDGFVESARFYYCPVCAEDFNRSDRACGMPPRCQIYPGDEL